MDYYENQHISQFDGSIYAKENCTPSSGANGVDASTGGAIKVTGAQVRALVKRSEETNPNTPGWSLEDLDKAMFRLGVPFELGEGGWRTALDTLDNGFYIVLQGDSDQFANATCSGIFNGNHAIGVHPKKNTIGLQRMNDPICPKARYESREVLERYARKFSAGIRYGIFTNRVPSEVDDMAGPDYQILEAIYGIATIDGPGHAIIKLSNGLAIAVPAGEQREVFAKIKLLKPYDQHPGDRQTGYLIGKKPGEPINKAAAFVLASDVKLTGVRITKA